MRTSRTARLAAALASGTLLFTLLAASPAGADASALPVVTPKSETPAEYDDEAGGDADADDPAIWRNPADPGRSLVVATAKQGGLRVYDLDAKLVQSLPAPVSSAEGDAPGRFNNVDLVTGLRTPAGRADVAVVSDRGNDRLRIYRIDPSRPADRRHRPGRGPGVLRRPGRDQRAAHRLRPGHLAGQDHRTLLRPGQPA
ncbi:hypothetical protein GCM10010129_62060 [Streptomyces fumigatiscleroticus]|nr:hypothetical protein GCM10010129_62060 [Streptomyces fumigatiscleroticus]